MMRRRRSIMRRKRAIMMARRRAMIARRRAMMKRRRSRSRGRSRSKGRSFMNRWRNGATLRLRTWRNTYVGMHSNGIHVKQGGAGPWEIFVVKRLPRYGFNCVALFGAHKRYLRARNNRKTIDQSGVRPNYNSFPMGWAWERFWVEPVGGGKVALRTIHNTYLRAHINSWMDQSAYLPKGRKLPKNWIWEKFSIQWLSGTCNERLTGHKHSGYRGCQNVTTSGRKCQKWTSQRPHRHSRTPTNRKFRGKGLGNHNYCRNPDGTRTIWCYTTDRRKRWEHCRPKKPGFGEAKRRRSLSTAGKAAALARKRAAQKRAHQRKWAAHMAKVKAKRAAAERAQKLKQQRKDALLRNKWSKQDADYKAAQAIREAEAKRQAALDSKLDRISTNQPTLNQKVNDVKLSSMDNNFGKTSHNVKVNTDVKVGGDTNLGSTKMPQWKEDFAINESKFSFSKLFFFVIIILLIIWFIKRNI